MGTDSLERDDRVSRYLVTLLREGVRRPEECADQSEKNEGEGNKKGEPARYMLRQLIPSEGGTSNITNMSIRGLS
jgi:hypothetical protein